MELLKVMLVRYNNQQDTKMQAKTKTTKYTNRQCEGGTGTEIQIFRQYLEWKSLSS